MGLRDLGPIKQIMGGLTKSAPRIALSIVLLIVFLGAGSFVGYKTTRYLETPEFCAISICHASMGAYSELYTISSHGQRNPSYQCMECHAETRLGTVENKYVGTLLSHVIDSPPAFIGLFQGKKPEPEFDPFYPTLPSERCLRCHAPDSKVENAFPVTARDHSTPIDVSEQFEWVLENPRGFKYQCKNCHSFITHPSDTELLPTERGEKYEYTHPGFPNMDLGTWQQSHWHLLREANEELQFRYYSGEEGETFEVTARELKVNGIPRQLDREMCMVCHKLRRPEDIDGKCQGCHAEGEITLFEHGEYMHIPNPNDYIGAKGIIGFGGETDGH